MMTEAEILEIARREVDKGIEEARKAGVVAGPIISLSVTRPEFRKDVTILNHCPSCRGLFDLDQGKGDDCPFCGARGLRDMAESQHQERLSSRHTAPSEFGEE